MDLKYKFLVLNLTNPTSYANEIPYLWMTLKSYFERNSRNRNLWEWLDPIYSDYSESPEEIINNIVFQEPDVLGISCYMWNDRLTLHIAKQVKLRLPNINIVAGGPSLYYERDKSWFLKHGYIDVVCEYAAYGEVFITKYLDQYQLEEVPFAVYPTLGGHHWNVSPAQYDRRSFNFPMPYADNISYLNRFPKDKVKIIVDTSRGCPYACSFCEWGGGTSTKTVFKTVEDTLLELDLAFSILKPEYVDVINANFGIVKDDITVAKKIVELHRLHNNCVKQVNLYGPTKVNKKNLKEIFEIFSEAGILSEIKISFQSANQTVLENIERIDTPYNEQLDLYNELTEKYGVKLKPEIMLGLPGETLDSFYFMLAELAKYDLVYPMIHEWMMLPSAPAANSEYIEKHKLKTKKVKYTADDYNTNYITKSDYGNFNQKNGKRNLLLDDTWKSDYEIVVSTYSYTVEEWVEMELYKNYFTFLTTNNIITPIQKHLGKKSVNLEEFNKLFFREFLLSLPVIQKIYKDFLENIKSEEPSDIFYADIGGNLPYFSHQSTLKFLMLINAKDFFSRLSSWINLKYGDDEYITAICASFAENIATPMSQDKPEFEKIKECISMCGYWDGKLFFDDFTAKY